MSMEAAILDLAAAMREMAAAYRGGAAAAPATPDPKASAATKKSEKAASGAASATPGEAPANAGTVHTPETGQGTQVEGATLEKAQEIVRLLSNTIGAPNAKLIVMNATKAEKLSLADPSTYGEFIKQAEHAIAANAAAKMKP